MKERKKRKGEEERGECEKRKKGRDRIPNREKEGAEM